MALFDAAVDLNPHQIEAALFALQSPISKGVLEELKAIAWDLVVIDEAHKLRNAY